MAKKLLTSLDFTSLEALRFRFQNLTADPSGVQGSAYMNTVTNKWMYHNGTLFVDPTARSQHTGTQLAASISDLSASVQAYRLDQFASPITSLSLNSQKIINLLPGILGTDAINLNQLLAVKNNTDWKDSVRIGTTTNVSLSGLQTIDGITAVVGDRILVKNNTTGSENGIWVAASGAWARSSDAATAGELTPATSMFIEEGVVNASTQWRITNTGTVTIGTTALTFTQFGAGTSYTSGNGIIITGSVIAVDTSVVARKFSASVGDGSTTSIAVTHSLATTDVQVSIRDATSNQFVDCDIVATSTTQVTFTFAVAPTSNQYRVTIIG
jgi:hypothetical protein